MKWETSVSSREGGRTIELKLDSGKESDWSPGAGEAELEKEQKLAKACEVLAIRSWVKETIQG